MILSARVTPVLSRFTSGLLTPMDGLLAFQFNLTFFKYSFRCHTIAMARQTKSWALVGILVQVGSKGCKVTTLAFNNNTEVVLGRISYPFSDPFTDINVCPSVWLVCLDRQAIILLDSWAGVIRDRGS